MIDSYEQRMSKTVTNITLENTDCPRSTSAQNINFVLNPIPIRSVPEQVPFKNNFFPPILQEPLSVSYPLYIQPQIRKPEPSIVSELELQDNEEFTNTDENDTEVVLPQSETSFSSRASCTKSSSFDFFDRQTSHINKTDSELALTSPYQENDQLEVSPASYSNGSSKPEVNHSDNMKTVVKKGRVEII